jgi:hypothetical protein
MPEFLTVVLTNYETHGTQIRQLTPEGEWEREGQGATGLK